MLPDDVLLEIFDVFGAMEDDEDEFLKMEAWQALVHVCRRWRSVVFGSPRRLELKLVCTNETPVRDTLDVWPALPLVIWGEAENVDNIIALLECSDRINQIVLWGSNWEDILEAMEVPFPGLTFLWLGAKMEPVIPLSNSFLGGSAPRLQYLNLYNIPFPGLPNLLSSATHLTYLDLDDIPHSGYMSPKAMVACLSLLTSLGELCLGFKSPQSRPDQESRRPPPLTRTVLSILTHFTFKGAGEYFEDLVAHIDAPQLNSFKITFFNDIVFDTPQFTQFISRTLTLEAFDKASVALWNHYATIELSSKTSDDGVLEVGISCRELDWQVSFLEQVCTSSLPPLSALEDLYIINHRSLRNLGDDIESSSWLELLHPFTAVKNLYLSEANAPHIMPALQELVAGRVTEVLPTLQNVFIDELEPSGPVQEGLEKFVAAREFTSHPIAVFRWDRDPSRPQVPHKIDLSSDVLCINPAHLSLPSPAPKSGRPISTSEFPEFMAALVASTRPTEIDLSMLSEEGPITAQIGLDSSLGTPADRPIELGMEGMDIDSADADVSLSGNEPPNDILTENPFDNTTTTGRNNPSPLSLREAFHRATAIDGDSQASVTSLPFDMTMNMDTVNFSSKLPSDTMMNTSDLGMIDVLELELLNMDPETVTQAEGQNAAGGT